MNVNLMITKIKFIGELLFPEISMFILQIQKIILLKETKNLMTFTSNSSNGAISFLRYIKIIKT